MDFYKKMIETELKQMFYWIEQATESVKKGERPFYEMNTATQHAAKINEYMEHISSVDIERGTDTVIDWKKLTDWAIKQARAEIDQENAENTAE